MQHAPVVCRAEIAKAVENRIGGGLSKPQWLVVCSTRSRRSISTRSSAIHSLLELVETVAQQRGPDAAGRQKPQLSCAKNARNCARPRTCRDSHRTPSRHPPWARPRKRRAPEFMRRQRHPAAPPSWTPGIHGAAGFQNFRDRHAERKFIDAGARNRRHGEQLRAGRELRAYLSEPLAAARRDIGTSRASRHCSRWSAGRDSHA